VTAKTRAGQPPMRGRSMTLASALQRCGDYGLNDLRIAGIGTFHDFG